MQSSNKPVAIPLPFADTGTKNLIPTASQIGVTPGAASLTDGFPPLTFTPLSAGGVPPFGADFNGILNMLSQTARWKQAGGSFVYDSAYATAIGGYPKGSTLMKSTLDGFWISTVDNNTANPDTGGAGWTDFTSGRLIRWAGLFSTQTYTWFTTCKLIRIRAWGAGGGGSGAGFTGSVMNPGSGGGAGGYVEWVGSPLLLGATNFLATIGAQGTAGTAGSTSAPGGNGGNGGQTTAGTIITATGGSGGIFAGGGGTGGVGSTTIPANAIITMQGNEGTGVWLGNIPGFGGGGYAAPGGQPHGAAGGSGVFPSGGGAGGGTGSTTSTPGSSPASGGKGGNGYMAIEEYS